MHMRAGATFCPTGEKHDWISEYKDWVYFLKAKDMTGVVI